MASISRWRLGRFEAVSKAGVVAAKTPLAAQFGAKVLEDGGNAVDAAVVTAAVAAVVEPWMNGFGGGGFLVRYDSKSGESSVVSYPMVAPRVSHPGHVSTLRRQTGCRALRLAGRDWRCQHHRSQSCVRSGYSGRAGIGAAEVRNVFLSAGTQSSYRPGATRIPGFLAHLDGDRARPGQSAQVRSHRSAPVPERHRALVGFAGQSDPA